MRTRIGLSSQCAEVSHAEVVRVAAALHKQVTRDLRPLWGIDASVEPLSNPDKVPRDVLPIFIRSTTPGHVGGLHTNAANGRPFAVVLVTRDWGLAASHECIEMLIDPTGNRLHPGRSLQIVNGVLQDGPDRVQYVVEACDPLEDSVHGYQINGVTVSDFYTPRYFDDEARAGVRYSHTGSITRPREVKPNGYLSWVSAQGPIRQLRWFGDLAIVELSDHTSAMAQHGISHRAFIDRNTFTPRQAPP